MDEKEGNHFFLNNRRSKEKKESHLFLNNQRSTEKKENLPVDTYDYNRNMPGVLIPTAIHSFLFVYCLNGDNKKSPPEISNSRVARF